MISFKSEQHLETATELVQIIRQARRPESDGGAAVSDSEYGAILNLALTEAHEAEGLYLLDWDCDQKRRKGLSAPQTKALARHEAAWLGMDKEKALISVGLTRADELKAA